MKLNIAFLQLLPAESIEENLEIGIAACKEAKRKGADIALSPEMRSIGYVSGNVSMCCGCPGA